MPNPTSSSSVEYGKRGGARSGDGKREPCNHKLVPAARAERGASGRIGYVSMYADTPPTIGEVG